MHPTAKQMTIYKCLLLLKNSIYHFSSYSFPFLYFKNIFIFYFFMNERDSDFRPGYVVVVVCGFKTQLIISNGATNDGRKIIRKLKFVMCLSTCDYNDDVLKGSYRNNLIMSCIETFLSKRNLFM